MRGSYLATVLNALFIMIFSCIGCEYLLVQIEGVLEFYEILLMFVLLYSKDPGRSRCQRGDGGGNSKLLARALLDTCVPGYIYVRGTAGMYRYHTSTLNLN